MINNNFINGFNNFIKTTGKVGERYKEVAKGVDNISENFNKKFNQYIASINHEKHKDYFEAIKFIKENPDKIDNLVTSYNYLSDINAFNFNKEDSLEDAFNKIEKELSEGTVTMSDDWILIINGGNKMKDSVVSFVASVLICLINYYTGY